MFVLFFVCYACVLLFPIASLIIRSVALVLSSAGTVLSTLHPMTVAVLYFSMSPRKPTDEVCRPPVQTPPSTSMAILCSGMA